LVGIVSVIIAVVYLLVARGLTNGSGLARGLAALVAVPTRSSPPAEPRFDARQVLVRVRIRT